MTVSGLFTRLVRDELVVNYSRYRVNFKQNCKINGYGTNTTLGINNNAVGTKIILEGGGGVAHCITPIHYTDKKEIC